jgi:hypothetical protein
MDIYQTVERGADYRPPAPAKRQATPPGQAPAGGPGGRPPGSATAGGPGGRPPGSATAEGPGDPGGPAQTRGRAEDREPPWPRSQR